MVLAFLRESDTLIVTRLIRSPDPGATCKTSSRITRHQPEPGCALQFFDAPVGFFRSVAVARSAVFFPAP